MQAYRYRIVLFSGLDQLLGSMKEIQKLKNLICEKFERW